MQTSVNTSVERIIAKIDNDYGFDNSDWIPRVGAWTIDAMGQMDALRKVRKKIKLLVNDGFACSHCDINSPNLIVTDCNGCIISKQKSDVCNDCNSSTGKSIKLASVTPNTVDLIENNCATNGPNMIASQINTSGLPHRYNYIYLEEPKCKSYVLVDKNKIELNFCTDYIYVETDTVDTVYSEIYECDIPVIPDVPLLIEAVAYYCVYKMLTRGYKHPVMNLAASQYGTNPFHEWESLKGQAKRSVIIDEQGNILVNDGNLFQSSFFITSYK